MAFRVLIGIALLAFLLAGSADAGASDYWLVGTGDKIYFFVDSASIQPVNDGTRWAWITDVLEGSKSVPGRINIL